MGGGEGWAQEKPKKQLALLLLLPKTGKHIYLAVLHKSFEVTLVKPVLQKKKSRKKVLKPTFIH